MVDYVCGGGCERALPIGQLYFCPSCPRLACQFCVTEEIDSYYCPNCLENLASAEASAFQNRCKKCFGCPMCFTALVPTSNAAGDLFFFACGFCRWSSLDIGMKSDQLVKLISDSNTRERTSPAQQAITSLVDELRRETKAAEKEKRMREKFKVRRTGLGGAAAEPPPRTTLSALEADRQARDQAVTFQGKHSTPPSTSLSPPSSSAPATVTKSEVHSVTTLEQRFSLLQTQPCAVSALVPHRIPLMTRRSCRCKGKDKEGKLCDKLLVKPEFSLTRAEFKRQLSALLTYVGAKANFIIGLSNPLKAVARLTLSAKASNVTLPAQQLSVGCLDVADLDDQYEKDKMHDNPQIVAQRKANVLCVFAGVAPSQPGQLDVVISLNGTSKPATGEMTFAVDVILHLGAVAVSPLQQLAPKPQT